MAAFLRLAELAEEMAGTASRLTKRKEIAEAIAAVRAACEPTFIENPIEMGHPDDVGLFCLYLAGLPFPEADPRKLNAGGSLLTRALLAVTSAGETELTAAYRRHGDLGAAAFDLFTSHRINGDGTLLLSEVSDAFGAIATARTTAIRAALGIGRNPCQSEC